MVLAKFASEWRDFGHNLYPSMVINDKIFRGRLTPDNTFENICSSFERIPPPCAAWYIQEELPLPEGVSTGINRETLAIIFFVLTVASIFIILVYRSWLQRELNKDMKIQVSSAVSQYVALNQIPELQNINSTRGNDGENEDSEVQLD